jgi:hypothetical protein
MRRTAAVVAAGCLVAGPVLQALSTYFWKDGYQGVDTGTLIVVATVCWIVGLAGVFRSIEDRVPRYAAVGFPLAVYGCVGGVSFGVQGMHEELFHADHAEAVRLLGEHPAAAFLAFWLAGPLFPVSLFVLGVVLTRLRVVPVVTGVLLCAGALAFPLSRIPRDAAVAHVADVLLLLPFVHLGLRLATDRWRGAPPSPHVKDEPL